MGFVRTFPCVWVVGWALVWTTAGAGAQTLAPISDQTYLVGGTNLPVPLLTSGFSSSAVVIRTMAANTTSGSNQKYEGPGTRIFQGLQPDVVMIQEFNVGGNSFADLRGWVDSTFGPEFSYYRENYSGIPNGVISRWPILQAGSWDDGPLGVGDRGFAWAQIDLPGERNLWVVSVHFKASSGSENVNRRNSQAQTLVGLIQANVPAEDYLLIGGDGNTFSQTEACLLTLSAVVDISSPWPRDEWGNANTNFGRSSPYDWVKAEPELEALEVPVTMGSLSFPDGLVFDSRVFSDLSLVAPVQSGDSGVTGMQHMAVIRSFQVQAPAPLTVQVVSSDPFLLPAESFWVQESGSGRDLYIFPVFGMTGSANVTVTVSDGVSSDTQSFTVTVSEAPMTLESWAVGYGLSGAEAGAGADPDGDGWSNAQEYAFGLVPNVAGGELVKVPAEGGKITYLQRSGVTYVVRSARELGTGFDGTVEPVWSSPQPGDVPAGYEQWEATMPAGNRGFLKVEATLP